MINYKDVEQGTEVWFRLKWGKIGGTASGGLFVKSDTLEISLLSEITEDFEMSDGFSSAAMTRGHELEPMALDYVCEYTGIDFENTGWLQCEENELLGISPDGITADETKSAEIKCFGRTKHMTVLLTDEIPKDNVHQCLHYFTVNPKLEEHYFCAFRPEAIKKAFVKKLTRESMLDLGTKAKPQIKTVQQWVDIARANADAMLIDIKRAIKELNF